MYAWRARIGFISPTHRGKVFAFWYDRAPEGVEIIPTFIGFRTSDQKTFESGFDRAAQLADDLKAAGCDLISVSGSPPVLLRGLDFERQWRDGLEQKLGIPVVTQMEPHAIAMQAMGIRRVAIATYYGDELNEAIVRYFRRFDIEGVLLGGFQDAEQNKEALYTTSLRALDEVSFQQVYRYVKRGVVALKCPVDGIYINGGGWDAVPAIAPLETDLHLPVIFALAAEMWQAYRLLRIEPQVEDCGALMHAPHP